MSKPARAHIKCDNGVRSPMTRWEPSQHERTTSLDHPMELQTDRTEIAPGGPSEVAEPLCAAHLRCGVHHAPLQEIAETVSRALAYLTDRLIWPYCLPAKAEQCLELHERIESTHEVYQRYAEANAANFILSDLHDDLARLLGNSLLNERDHTPMGKKISISATPAKSSRSKIGWQLLV